MPQVAGRRDVEARERGEQSALFVRRYCVCRRQFRHVACAFATSARTVGVYAEGPLPPPRHTFKRGATSKMIRYVVAGYGCCYVLLARVGAVAAYIIPPSFTGS